MSMVEPLPALYRLHWYVIERILGHGGFGVTYLAHDTNLDRRVAIKEYLPRDVSFRNGNRTVKPLNEFLSGSYVSGLGRFLTEARTLAKFDHPHIVRVLSVFEENGTAYIVMRFEDGEDLATLLDRQGTVEERKLLSIILPVLDGLRAMHAEGFIHRDIKPANIYVRNNGSPVLLDFGSARQGGLTDKATAAFIAPGYAPLEQYFGEAKQQGAWGDLYGLGATCYRAVAGVAPVDAVARAKGVLSQSVDPLVPASEVGKERYAAHVLAAIDHALELSENNRPQSVDAWRDELQLADRRPVRPMRASAVNAASSRTRWNAPNVKFQVRAAASVGVVSTVLALTFLASRPVSLTKHVDDSAPPNIRAATTAATPLADVGVPLPAASKAENSNFIAQPTASTTVSGFAPSNAQAARSRGAQLAAPAAMSLRQEPDSKTPRAAFVLATSSSSVPATPVIAGSDASSRAELTASTTAGVIAASQPGSVLPDRGDAAGAEFRSAERAVRQGDHDRAKQLLGPLAVSGDVRAQVLLAQIQELRRPGGSNDFEAYIWYSVAARRGDAAVNASRERIAARLLPAERQQADRIVEDWMSKPAGGSMGRTEAKVH